MGWKFFDFKKRYYESVWALIILSIGLLVNLLGLYSFYVNIHSFMNFGAGIAAFILGLPATLPFLFTSSLYADLSEKFTYLFELAIILVNLIFYYFVGYFIGRIIRKVKKK
jgi:hypothetical protein